jgi:hypothetical protein
MSACAGSGNCMLMRITYLELLYEYSHSTPVRGEKFKKNEKTLATVEIIFHCTL